MGIGLLDSDEEQQCGSAGAGDQQPTDEGKLVPPCPLLLFG